jgi:hypothetical protein
MSPALQTPFQLKHHRESHASGRMEFGGKMMYNHEEVVNSPSTELKLPIFLSISAAHSRVSGSVA